MPWPLGWAQKRRSGEGQRRVWRLRWGSPLGHRWLHPGRRWWSWRRRPPQAVAASTATAWTPSPAPWTALAARRLDSMAMLTADPPPKLPVLRPLGSERGFWGGKLNGNSETRSSGIRMTVQGRGMERGTVCASFYFVEGGWCNLCVMICKRSLEHLFALNDNAPSHFIFHSVLS